MTFIEKVEFLFSFNEVVPVTAELSWNIFSFRLYLWKVTNGWISLDDQGDHFSLFWTNRRVHRCEIAGYKAYAIDINKKTGELHQRMALSGVWESETDMVPVEEAKKVIEIYDWMLGEVDMAYKWQRALNAYSRIKKPEKGTKISVHA